MSRRRFLLLLFLLCKLVVVVASCARSSTRPVVCFYVGESVSVYEGEKRSLLLPPCERGRLEVVERRCGGGLGGECWLRVVCREEGRADSTGREREVRQLEDGGELEDEREEGEEAEKEGEQRGVQETAPYELDTESQSVDADEGLFREVRANVSASVVASLLEQGASVEARGFSAGEEEETVLHLAASNGHADVVELLLDRGAAVDSRNGNESTPLHLASSYGWLEGAWVLLNRNASIEATGRREETSLHRAAQHGQVNVVELLFDRNASIEARDEWENTPLHRAAQHGQVNVVELLLDRNASIEAKDEWENAPLHRAAERGHVNVTELLLDRNASIEARDQWENMPLHRAAERGHVNVTELLLDRNASIEARDQWENTPLHRAAERGHVNVIELLLDRNASIDARDQDDETSLTKAFEHNHEDVVHLLLLRGANVSVRLFGPWYSGNEKTPLHRAAEQGWLAVARLLLARGVPVDARASGVFENQRTPLHYAARNGHVEIVRLLLENGAASEARDRDQKTALHHLAALRGHLEIVQKLLNGGAAVDSRTEEGRTALHLAVTGGHLEIVRKLLNGGAAVDSRTEEGRTALHLAVTGGHLEIVRKLLNGGAAVDSRTEEGRTALHLAVTGGHLEIVRKLLNGGAAVDSRTEEGRTALHLAVTGGHLEIVRKLLNGGAAVDSRTEEGRTALHLAVTGGHLEIVRKLLNGGAAVDSRTEEGRTALHLAVTGGHLEIVRKLLNGGAAVDSRTEEGRTALHLAALRGHLEIVRELLNGGAAVDSRDNRQQTPLFRSVVEGRVEIGQLLLERGALVDAVDNEGSSPLHRAAALGWVDVAEMLLNAGASMVLQDERMRTPWSIALPMDQSEILQLFERRREYVSVRESESGRTMLMFAAEEGDVRVVQELLDRGANVSAVGGVDPVTREERGETALFYAAAVGAAEVVSLLLQNGSDADVASFLNYDGASLLHAAAGGCVRDGVAGFDSGKTVELLLQRGFSAGVKGKRNHRENSTLAWTPLHGAAKMNCKEAAEVLISQGNASLTALDVYGLSPLHVAARFGSVSVLSLFVSLSPDNSLFTLTPLLRTPLHLASASASASSPSFRSHGRLHKQVTERMQIDTLEFLFERDRGAVTARDSFSFTPLHLDAMEGNTAAIQFLVRESVGADLNARGGGTETDEEGGISGSGVTPLMLAAQQGHADAVEALLSAGAHGLSATHGDGRQAIHFAVDQPVAVEERTVAVLRSLLRRFSASDRRAALAGVATDRLREKPLHIAARGGSLGVVKLLVKSELEVRRELGASVVESRRQTLEVVNGNSRTPLLEAAAGGHLDVVRFLLSRESDGEAVGEGGWTVLHLAASSGTLAVVRELLSRRVVETDAVDWSGMTALHLGSSSGREDILQVLLENGAEPNRRGADGSTPMVLAARAGSLPALRVLWENGGRGVLSAVLEPNVPESSLRSIVLQSRPQSDSADPRDIRRKTQTGTGTDTDVIVRDAIRSLLGKYPFPLRDQIEDNYSGQGTALQIASSRGLTETVRFLLQENADPNAATPIDPTLPDTVCSLTPLLLAASRGHQSPAILLLAGGGLPHASGFLRCGDVEPSPVARRTVLHCAAAADLDELVSRLVEPERGVDLAAQDEQGRTALMLAARSGAAGAVRALLGPSVSAERRKAQLVALDRDGKHAMDFAQLGLGRGGVSNKEVERLLDAEDTRGGRTFDDCKSGRIQCVAPLECKDKNPGFWSRGSSDELCIAPPEWRRLMDSVLTQLDNKGIIVQYSLLGFLILLSLVLMVLVPMCKVEWREWEMQIMPVLGAILQVNNIYTDLVLLVLVGAAASSGLKQGIGFFAVLLLHAAVVVLFNAYTLKRFHRRYLREQKWWAEVHQQAGAAVLFMLGLLSLRFAALATSNLFGVRVLSMKLSRSDGVGKEVEGDEDGLKGERNSDFPIDAGRGGGKGENTKAGPGLDEEKRGCSRFVWKDSRKVESSRGMSIVHSESQASTGCKKCEERMRADEREKQRSRQGLMSIRSSPWSFSSRQSLFSWRKHLSYSSNSSSFSLSLMGRPYSLLSSVLLSPVSASC
uniref:Uncharacterized protein n=1 Tax=Chromera velia CCMP2878 TaxID=1169474 RepID=A0A0G4I9R6_9ALVE|eukprot:Cvel_12347.t1-p1 / transcript=Cvel_12347.t1 / gene=Cvel_12347 / organism=Chromera_velia_CCMP2878 / gene_product=Ankyrin-3, putative / transcript_product=Ankyrin-3, putative / location=Cvel_scaffold803:40855-48852(-) / protein_length=2070 / sequence_SO=supercontig / SO=protein_coding / is_pseudo=false